MCMFLFFFKQKTAYEMRISDWSSDVCSSDLISSGSQVAIMAPTEILAEQHYQKLSSWLQPLGVQVAWLTGSLTGKERKAAIQAIESGQAQLVVGTPALIQDQVVFARLGLTILDEIGRASCRERVYR